MTTTKALIGTACVAAAIGIFMISRQRGNTAEEPAPSSRAAAGNPASPAPEARFKNPLQVPRLTAAERTLLATDPAKAVAADQENLDLLVAWAALNPVAALAWADAQKDPLQSRANLLGAIATGILIKDGPDAMRRFLAAHKEDPNLLPKHQDARELLSHTLTNLARDDSAEAAMELLRAENDGSLAGSMVLGVKGDAAAKARAIDYLEAKGIPVAVEYWPFQEAIRADPRYWADWSLKRDSDLTVEIVQAWHREHPAEARAWIDDRIPANDPRRQDIETLIAP